MTELFYDPFDLETDRDPYPIWKRLRDEDPVNWNERYGFFALSRFADVVDACNDTATFSSSRGTTLDSMDAPITLPRIIVMDPPEHEVMRKLVSRAFTPRRIGDLETEIQRLVDDYLDRFVDADEFDYVKDFAAHLPPMVIGEMLGVPREDRDRLRRWFDEMLHRDGDSPGLSPPAQAAITELLAYASALVEDRRRNPGDDMVSVLVEAELEDGGETRQLTDLEIAAFVLQLAGAGSETVARHLGFAAVLLAQWPDQRRLLVDDPALVPNAVEEVLRYEAPSPRNGRWTLRPYSAHGVDIPAGSKVLLLNGSANRDEREFADPDVFDVRRAPGRHASLGYGVHYCLGAALARMEARLALASTLARFPDWEIEESELQWVRTSSVRGYSSVPLHVT
jgi:cytochrome P450